MKLSYLTGPDNKPFGEGGEAKGTELCENRGSGRMSAPHVQPRKIIYYLYYYLSEFAALRKENSLKFFFKKKNILYTNDLARRWRRSPHGEFRSSNGRVIDGVN